MSGNGYGLAVRPFKIHIGYTGLCNGIDNKLTLEIGVVSLATGLVFARLSILLKLNLRVRGYSSVRTPALTDKPILKIVCRRWGNLSALYCGRKRCLLAAVLCTVLKLIDLEDEAIRCCTNS